MPPPFQPLPFLSLLLLLSLLLPLATSTTPPALTSPQKRTLKALHSVLITTYLRHHKRNRNTHPRLVYRLSLSQPGLGDRLTGLLYAYVISALTDRILLIHWQHPYNLDRFLLSNSAANFYYTPTDLLLERTKPVRHCLHTCPFPHLSPFYTANNQNFTVVYNISQPFSTNDIFKLARRHSHLPQPHALLLKANLTHGPLHSHYLPPDQILFSRIFHTILRPTPDFNAFIKQHAASLLPRRYISVHARLGTGVNESGPRFETPLTWHRIASCLALRARQMGRKLNTHPIIFLATDTPQFRSAFRRAVHMDGGNATSVWFGTWGTKHVGRMRVGNARDEELFQIALMELILLGRGEGMVSTVSRYARVAGFIGSITEHVFVVPENDC